MPLGLTNGLGGVLWCCGTMESAGIPGAEELTGSVLRLLLELEVIWSDNVTVREGLSGLLLALGSLPKQNTQALSCARLGAERLLAAEIPDKPELMSGTAGLAAALSEAFRLTGDARCAERAEEVLREVRDAYEPSLGGWPDSRTKIRWMADRGPQAAGIALAAFYAGERLDTPAARELLDLAALSLTDAAAIKIDDTLEEGNALDVLTLLRLGEIERAGRVLEAMARRADIKGSFAVAPAGIRSAFDPSVWMGSLGVGVAALRYLETMGKEDDK